MLCFLPSYQGQGESSSIEETGPVAQDKEGFKIDSDHEGSGASEGKEKGDGDDLMDTETKSSEVGRTQEDQNPEATEKVASSEETLPLDVQQGGIFPEDSVPPSCLDW